MRTLIAAGNLVICEGLRSILAKSRLETVGTAASAAEVVEQVRALRPTVAILDASIAGADGYAALEAIKRVSPGTAVIILSMHGDAPGLFDAVAHGASGYLVHDVSERSLALAVEAAGSGFILADHALLRRELGRLRRRATPGAGPEPGLTPREREVLGLVSEGLSNREIAGRLTVTVGTVKTHVSSILEKLQVADRVRAAAWAREHDEAGEARLAPGQAAAM